MTESQETFPVVNKPLSASQWESVTSGLGNGVIDAGDGGYRLSFDNATDTVTVAPPLVWPRYAHAAVAGYYHRLYEAVKLSVPPVTIFTVYSVVLCYDPTRADTKPVELKVVKGALDQSNGKKYLVLATIEREPNRILTDSRIIKQAPRITPAAEVETWEALPIPENFLLGTLMHVQSTASVYRNSKVNGRLQWVRISGTTAQNTLSMPGWRLRSNIPGGMLITPTPDGWKCEFHGQFIRDAFDYTVGDQWSDVGEFIPPRFRRDEFSDIQVAGTYFDPNTGAVPVTYTVNFQTGVLSVRMPRGQSLFIRKEGALNLSVTWVSKRERAES